MKCIKCESEIIVSHLRASLAEGHSYLEYECLECSQRWTVEYKISKKQWKALRESNKK